jgi:hypothetical protein
LVVLSQIVGGLVVADLNKVKLDAPILRVAAYPALRSRLARSP